MPVAGSHAPRSAAPGVRRERTGGRIAGICGALLAAAVILASVPPLAAAQTADQSCSRQTAEQVAGPTSPWLGDVSDPVDQVLCGAFAGSGSTAMAVSLSAATCWSPQAWAIYVLSDGQWQQKLLLGDWLSQPLALIDDGGIREVVPVFNRYDPRCLPSGGTRGRTWKWNGSRFTASRWSRTREQIVLSGPAACHLQDDGTPTGSFAYCWTGRKHARLGADGSIDARHRMPLVFGIGGPDHPAGYVATAGRMRCRVHRRDVTCWNRGTGKGMRFSTRGTATRVQVKT